MHTTPGINLEIIMLSERSQPPKATNYDSIYMDCPALANLESESRLVAARSGERMEREATANGYRIYFRR